MIDELLKEEMPAAKLKAAKVSKNQYEQVKMLISFDKNIFDDES